MTHYQLWVLLHVASVIVWLGAGTPLALAMVYAQRAADRTAVASRLVVYDRDEVFPAAAVEREP